MAYLLTIMLALVAPTVATAFEKVSYKDKLKEALPNFDACYLAKIASAVSDHRQCIRCWRLRLGFVPHHLARRSYSHQHRH